MPYWFLNKETNKTGIYGSLPVLCNDNDLEYKKIQYQFRKLTKFETEKLWIERKPLQRTPSK
jgi:hypothetical protein